MEHIERNQDWSIYTNVIIIYQWSVITVISYPVSIAMLTVSLINGNCTEHTCKVMRIRLKIVFFLLIWVWAKPDENCTGYNKFWKPPALLAHDFSQSFISALENRASDVPDIGNWWVVPRPPNNKHTNKLICVP